MNSFLSQGKGFLSSKKDALQDEIKVKASNHVEGLTNMKPFGALPSFEPEDMLTGANVKTSDDSDDVQSPKQPNANYGFQTIAGNIESPFAGKFGHARDTFRRGYDMRDEIGNDNLPKERKGLETPLVANGQQFIDSGRSAVVANVDKEKPFANDIPTVGGKMSGHAVPSIIRRTGRVNGLERQRPARDNHLMGTGRSVSGTERRNTPTVSVHSIAHSRTSIQNVPENIIDAGAINPRDKRGAKGERPQADYVEAKNGATKGNVIRGTTNETINETGKYARANYIGSTMDRARDLPNDVLGNVSQTPINLQHQQSDITQAKQAINSVHGMKGKVNKNDLIKHGSALKASHIGPVADRAQGVSGGFVGNIPHLSTPANTASSSRPVPNGPPGQPAREEAKTTAFDNFGADLSMDNIKQNGKGFLSTNTGIDVSQIQDFGITGKDSSDKNGEAKSETNTSKLNPENVLGMFAALSNKVDTGKTARGSSCSTDESGGEKYFVARFEDTRGPSCSYTKGVIVRLLLIALNTFTTVLAVNASGNHFLWGCPPFCAIFLSLEYAAVVFKRLGREWTWWLPSLIVYLVTTLPLVWELQLRNSGFDDNGAVKKTDLWTIIVCDATVYVTIFARWMLQGGAVSILTLATVLLDFLANASDIMDLLSLTDEIEVRTNSTLLYWVLIAWSLSFIKFIPLIEQRAGDKPKTLPGYIQRSCGPKFTDILQTLFTLLLLDGSFLLVRLYLLIAESVVTFSLIFFVVKNVLGFVMQFHRLVVLCQTMPCVHRTENQTPEPE